MMKKKKYLFVVILLIMSVIKVDALSVSKNNITMEKGGKEIVELYANIDKNVSSIEFTLTYTTYDIPADFIVNSIFKDGNPNGIKHNIQFEESQTGKILLGTVNINTKSNPTDSVGTINITGAKAITTEGETVNLNKQDINIKIGTIENDNPNDVEEEIPVDNNNNTNNNDNKKEEETKKEETKKEENKNTNKDTNKDESKKEENYNLLEKIDSEIVKITILENVFEYTITINKEVTELDLKPIAINKDAKIEVSSQKVEELNDNKILITVKDVDKEQIYTINVRIIKDFEKAEIDNSEFKENDSYKGKWLVVTVVLIILLIGSTLFTKKR